MSQIERELGWDDEIQKDGGGFVLLPAGDYNFTVTKFERGRFAGSDKMPPCNQAKLEITVHSPEHGDVVVPHNLFLHSKTEGLLSNFFTGIGLKKKGEPLRMNWNATLGRRGRLRLEVRNYTYNGEERSSNQIKSFYAYDDVPTQQQQPQYNQAPQYNQQAQQNFQQPPQQTYQQPQQQHQPPFPTGQQNGGWSAGQF
ncbi:hypothetical protein [Brevibacillus borstelensis]|uniref:hypothetical protein n=1 Tax=Brevibacillus borstelensis TaxID=45462 RepID=UPI0030BAD0B4